jgi:hypothetical protein
MNQPVEQDLQMLQDLGLDPNWDKHNFRDQEEKPADHHCAREICEIEGNRLVQIP